jgi:cobalt-zinc-cadmium efflux system membrane fusion protein
VRLSGDGRSIAVVSPISGRVTGAPANLGRFVAAETELFRVADPRRLQITASLPPADAPRVRAGDRVELTTSDGRTVEGRVRSDTGVVDPETRAATVIVTPTAGGSTLIPGQLVQARIFASGGVARDGVMVPQDAVQTIGDRTVVFARTRTGFKARTVQVGSRSGGLVAITSGLAAGTRIATTNAFLLKAEIEKESAE